MSGQIILQCFNFPLRSCGRGICKSRVKTGPEERANREEAERAGNGPWTNDRKAERRTSNKQTVDHHIPKREQITSLMNRGRIADWNNFGLGQCIVHTVQAIGERNIHRVTNISEHHDQLIRESTKKGFNRPLANLKITSVPNEQAESSLTRSLHHSAMSR